MDWWYMRAHYGTGWLYKEHEQKWLMYADICNCDLKKKGKEKLHIV